VCAVAMTDVALGCATRVPVPATGPAHSATAASVTRSGVTRAALAPRPPAVTAESPDLTARLDALARAAVADLAMPIAGLAVRVDWRGTTVLERGYGFADRDTGRHVAADTVFRIGSITKPFTAALILKLQAVGKLSIDRPAAELLPAGVAAPDPRITLRHLLSHTSGLANYTSLPWFDADIARPLPRPELVRRVIAESLGFEPGSRFAYSNSGYYLLGMVAEAVTGQSYGDLLRAQILAPAGLNHTGVCPDEPVGPAARGYRIDAGALRPSVPMTMQNPFAAGALCSTVGDLARFARQLAGGAIVDGAAWTAMRTPVRLSDGTTSPYGLGLFTGAFEGHVRLAHGGGINGFVSDLSLFPDDDLIVVVLINTEGNTAGVLGEHLARAVLGLHEPEIKDLPVSAAEAESLLGRYLIRDIGQTLVITFDGKSLRAANPAAPQRAVRLRAQGDGAYAVPEIRARFRFELAQDPAAPKHATRILIHQGGHDLTAERLPDEPPSPH
jgi:D-alanyl-D-alanine carboxypeptidase